MTPKGAKKEPHLFDKMYLFEDINFSTQDEEEKERTGARFETLLRSMNVSYKIIVSNHYADNNRLREAMVLPWEKDKKSQRNRWERLFD